MFSFNQPKNEGNDICNHFQETSNEKYSTALLVQHRSVWKNQLSRLAQKSHELTYEGGNIQFEARPNT